MIDDLFSSSLSFLIRFLFLNAQCHSPVFLLFLECVWQLVHQHSPAFQFSETYLTVLSDSVHVPVFSTFLFNSAHHRESVMKVKLMYFMFFKYFILMLWLQLRVSLLHYLHFKYRIHHSAWWTVSEASIEVQWLKRKQSALCNAVVSPRVLKLVTVASLMQSARLLLTACAWFVLAGRVTTCTKRHIELPYSVGLVCAVWQQGPEFLL